MKIAVCISGQPRSVKAGAEYLTENLLDKFDCEIFIHTWSDDNFLPFDVSETYGAKGLGYAMSQVDKPFKREHITERYPRVDNPSYPAFNTYSMWYSVFRANQLKKQWEDEKGFTFDYVVRTRFDFLINKPIDFIDVEASKIYVPDCRNDPNRLFCSDQFAYGTSEVMDLYSNTFMNIDFLYGKGVTMNGEHMLSANLQAYGLVRENMIYKNFNPPFPPGKYDGNWHYICREDFSTWNSFRK